MTTIMENIRGRKKRAIAEPDKPYNVKELEQDIEEAAMQAHDLDQEAVLEIYIPKKAPSITVEVALPTYVEHHTNVDDIGKLSAAAIVQQYEDAAVTLELMGKDLIDVARQAEKMATDVKEAIKYVEAVAQKYRDEAKVIFDRIEKASILTNEVKATCNEMRQRIEENHGALL